MNDEEILCKIKANPLRFLLKLDTAQLQLAETELKRREKKADERLFRHFGRPLEHNGAYFRVFTACSNITRRLLTEKMPNAIRRQQIDNIKYCLEELKEIRKKKNDHWRVMEHRIEARKRGFL